MVRLRWSGNGSRKYDGRIEDVPVRCVFPEDLPLTVGKNVRVLLDCGAGASVERDGGRREEAAECVAASPLGEAISALWPGKYHFAIILVACAQGVTLCFHEHVAAALRRRGGNPAPARRLLTAALFAVCTLNVSRLVLALA